LPLSFGYLPSFEILWFLRIYCWMHIFPNQFLPLSLVLVNRPCV
jgi:hypothetical protein